MKALVLHAVNDFRVEHNWPDPELKDGWAIIKVAYSGICGSDLQRFFETGTYQPPRIFGHEFSGIVERTNCNSRIAAGTKVAIMPVMPCGECDNCKSIGEPFHCTRYGFIGSRNDGGFAEFCVVKEKNLFRLDEISLQRGAMLEIACVGLHAVRRSGCTSGKAIVYGAGAIGISIAAWLEYCNVDVTIVDIREYSLGKAMSLGIKKAVQFDSISDRDFDFAFEASGANQALNHAINSLKRKGTLTIVGRSTSDTRILSELYEKMTRYEIDLHGCWGYNVQNDEGVIREAMKAIPFERMISHTIRLEESIPMLQKMQAKSVDYCKVMIDMRKE